MKNEINEERRMKNEELTKHEGRKTRSKNRRKRTLRAHSSFLILHSSFICFLLCLTGCRTATPPLDYRALVRAADRLGMDIGPKDHHALYLEAAQWIGTPYRSGGQSRKGTDCSGFVRQVYKKVYGIDLPRSTTEQVEEGKRVRRRLPRQQTTTRQPRRHLPEGRQVCPRQHQPGRHGQPTGRGLLGRALAAGKTNQLTINN